jgi:signal transduction histidine kinase
VLELLDAHDDVVAAATARRSRLPAPARAAAWERAVAGIHQVAEMRTFAHPTASKSRVDINEPVRNTLIVTANGFRDAADVSADLGEVEPVLCNAGTSATCIVNLVVDATDAVSDTGAHGAIAIRTRQDGGDVVISVSDSGPAIPDEIADRIFEPFFTTKEVGRGTGQGLAIARAIVTERHGGTIGFTTELGRGTTFEVRLPSQAARQVSEAQ